MIAGVAEAQAQCLALDLGPSACADLVEPHCGPSEVVRLEAGRAPFCVEDGRASPAKAAVLLREAQARQAAIAGPPWLLIGGAVAVGGLVLVWALH